MNNLRARLIATNIFEENAFFDLYVELICQNRQTKQQKYITQRHHIIPKAYFKKMNLQLDDSRANYVHLVFRDHILAHYYLARCVVDIILKYDMLYAVQLILGHPVLDVLFQQELKEFVMSLDEYQNMYEEAIRYRIETNPGTFRNGHEVQQEVRDKISQKLRGRKKSEEARKNMSEAAKRRRSSEETKNKISKTMTGRKQPWAARKQSQEEIEKRRQKLIGHITTEETRQKISKANKGRKLSEQTKKKISEACKGKPSATKGLPSAIRGKIAIHDPSTSIVKYITEENLSMYVNDGWVRGLPSSCKRSHKSINSREVLCIETGVVYESVNSACSAVHADIYKSLHDPERTSGGYHWKYVDSSSVKKYQYKKQ